MSGDHTLSCPADKSDSVRELVELVRETNDATQLKAGFEKYRKAAIEWFVDDDDLDILHHAILANNIEAISLLFMRGFFKFPHETPSFSYPHLAAYVGHRTILNILLQERRGDNIKTVFDYPKNSKRFDKEHESKTPGEETQKSKTPLDIAGERGHTKCVHTILDNYHGDTVFKRRGASVHSAYVDLACELDSPQALRLLLSDNPSERDIRDAIKKSVKMARAECLDILLRLKPDVSDLFTGMNLYHVLYSYSKSFDKSWYAAMVAVTTVLIRHHHDLIQCKPFRTYPLYSLLAHESCQNLDSSGAFLIACLVLLLNAGADPNFDEILLENELKEYNIPIAFGREPFSTAFHCLFDTIGKYSDGWEKNLSVRYYTNSWEKKLSVRYYMNRAIDALLKHGANLRHCSPCTDPEGSFGNPMHSYCKIVPKIGLGEDVVHKLLKNGGDVDAKVLGLYPLDVLYRELLNRALTSGLTHVTEVENSVIIMDNMSLIPLSESERTFKEIVTEFKEKYQNRFQTTNDIISKISSQYRQRLNHVWSLKKFCIMSVWVNSKRRMSNVLRLPIPKRLREIICDGIA